MGAKTDEEAKAGEEYNPSDHKTTVHPTTYCETFIHLFKGIFGAGVLSMPIAFSISGYITGIVGMIVISLCITYSARALVKSQEELCKRRKVPELSYQATAYEAFMEGPPFIQGLSKAALHLCNSVLIVSQIGTACVLVVFIGSNLQGIAESYSDQTFTTREMILYLFVPVLMVSLVRELKYLAPISTFGSITVIASVGVLFYFMLTDIPPISSRRPFGNISDLPEFFSLLFFGVGCIPFVLPLYNKMKDPEQFTAPFGVLNMNGILVAVLSASIGFAGYIKYGDNVQASVTLNLPKDHIASHVVQALLCFTNLFTIPLTIYVTYCIFLESYCKDSWKKHKLICELVFRVSVVCIIAIVLPNFELVISLTGVLAYIFLGTILPCTINIAVRSSLCTTAFGKLFFISHNLMIILGSLVIFVYGFKSNIEKIMILFGFQ